MLTLAREGDAVSETESLVLRTVATQAWDNVMAESASLEINSSVQFEADRSRLTQVFENLYRNAIEYGGEDVMIRVGSFENGFIEDSGASIPDDKQTDVFHSGYTTDKTGPDSDSQLSSVLPRPTVGKSISRPERTAGRASKYSGHSPTSYSAIGLSTAIAFVSWRTE
jgi:signal transduction histidine kinase